MTSLVQESFDWIFLSPVSLVLFISAAWILELCLAEKQWKSVKRTFEIDSRGVVTGFHEKVAHPPGNLANGAIYILSAQFLPGFRTNFRGARDFSTEVLPRFMGRIFTWETTAPFVDVGTPAALKQANTIAGAAAP